jgi:hypothetical protein
MQGVYEHWYDIGIDSYNFEMHKTKNNMSCTQCTTNAIQIQTFANSEQQIIFE